jgi:hypothetical protein
VPGSLFVEATSAAFIIIARPKARRGASRGLGESGGQCRLAFKYSANLFLIMLVHRP